MKNIITLILLFTVWVSSIHAAPNYDVEAIEQQHANILQKEQNRVDYKKRQQAKKDIFLEVDTKTLAKEPLQKEACFQIETIEIIGNTVLKTSQFLPIRTKYEKQCLGNTKISNLLSEITNLYIQAGYITSKAYLKAQDLASGTLKVHIHEGMLNQILLNQKERSEVTMAFPHTEDSILNLRDIEMGLEQINRLNTNNASVDIQASQKEGYSDINIINDQSSHLFSAFSLSNNGSADENDYTASADFYVENLLGLNEQFSFNLNGSIDQGDYKRSYGRSVDFSIPYGYFTFSSGYRTYLYRSTVEGEQDNYVSSGVSTTYSQALDYTMHRDSSSITKLKLGLNVKENLNFFSNELIKVSSQKLTIGTAGISYSLSHPKRSIYGEFTFKKGLPWFDPLKDSDHPSLKAQFSAYSLYLFLNEDLSNILDTLSLKTTLSGQYSGDKLYSLEQFSIGSLYTVRGFQLMSYSGDIGAYIKNDLSISRPVRLFKKVTILSPYIGLDVGSVEYDPDIYKWMVGSAIGVKLNTKNTFLDFTVSRPLYAYDSIREEEFVLNFNFRVFF
ncbi:MAG: ShlB/FhaC/HecB family hemolysin secretion/activation protein [Epsilonproteobacteria bacterium]|nr:ShlB/FhaC/HecB family hemolysin secretion/activation protein [Campylobacterota bacterium]